VDEQAQMERAHRPPKRGGGRDPNGGSGPSRRCVATFERRPKPCLLRLVLGPDGVPFVDILGRAPGRGVYVSPERVHLEATLSRKGLTRAFKDRAAPLDEGIVERIILDATTRLEERILELVSLARRAGKLEIGMDATLRTVADHPDALVVAAKDLSERSERSIPEARTVVRISDKATLGRRLGRDEVGIVAIRPSVFTERLEYEAERLRAIASTSTKTVRHGRVRARQKRARDND
jgi:predicted RNA-binding protein YlxR (DUF448 family)